MHSMSSQVSSWTLIEDFFVFAYCLKCESASRCSQPGEGPNRNFLHDYKIFLNHRLKLYLGRVVPHPVLAEWPLPADVAAGAPARHILEPLVVNSLLEIKIDIGTMKS